MSQRDSAEFFEALEAIFHEALEQPAEQRPTFLDRACADRPELRAEVEELLRAAEGAEDRVGSLVDEQIRDWVDSPADAPRSEAEAESTAVVAPTRIGPYRVLRPLGRGGQGTVYLAEREGDGFRQQAAVKILDRGIGGADARTRFRLERRILASLENPGIARFLDGGTTEEDRLYVALEYVEGDPIDRHCEERGLGLRERIELFCRAAEAVDAAHRQLVVHRDLKPSNLLVTARGEPKLLDFGIAKLLETDPETEDEITATHDRRLTPGYASPEQLRGEAVGVASDVYSLGVLLYRLLTGSLPYDRATKAAAALGAELPKAERPSIRARKEGAEVAGLDATRLWRRLRGDLDAIVAKALRSDVAERYASVDRLVGDLRRYLDGRPVQAARGNAAYRVGKWIRRNWTLLLALIVFTIVAFSLFTSRVDRVRAERDKAAIEDFLGRLIGSGAPELARGETDSAARFAEDAARNLEHFSGAQTTRADLTSILAGVFHGLGRYDQARSMTESTVALRRELGNEQKLADSLVQLGALYLDQGERKLAEDTYSEALVLARSLPRPWDSFFEGVEEEKALLLASAVSGSAHAHYLTGELEKSEDLYRESLALRLEASGPDHPDVAESFMGLSAIAFSRGEMTTAEDFQRKGLDTLVNAHGELHLDVAQAMRNLSAILDDLEEAEALALRAIEIQQKLRGGPSLADGLGLLNVGFIRKDRGDFAGALDMFHQAADLTAAQGGPDHENLARILRGRGEMELELGDAEAAERSWQEGLRIARAQYGPSWSTARLLHNLGLLRLDSGRAAEAEPYLRDAFEQMARARPGHWRIADAQSALGACLGALGQIDEGRRLIEASLEQLEAGTSAGSLAAAERAAERAAAMNIASPAGHG